MIFFYIIRQVAPKIINLEQRHKGLAEISASPSFFIVSDKRQIRTNRLLPKGSDYFDLVELKAAKTHTVLYQINRTEYYCQVDLPLSDYPLYGKQLVASRG